MTCVCSVGLDMIAVPGDTTAETISAIIADEAAIGMVNNKTTAVRIIPAPGKTVGDTVEMGGLLGSAPVMPVHAGVQRGLHRPRRPHPRAAAQPEELTVRYLIRRRGIHSERLHLKSTCFLNESRCFALECVLFTFLFTKSSI